MPDPATVDLDGAAVATPTPRAGRPTYRRDRRAMQAAEIARLASELALQQWHLPLLPVAGLGGDDVTALIKAMRTAPG